MTNIISMQDYRSRKEQAQAAQMPMCPEMFEFQGFRWHVSVAEWCLRVGDTLNLLRGGERKFLQLIAKRRCWPTEQQANRLDEIESGILQYLDAWADSGHGPNNAA